MAAWSSVLRVAGQKLLQNGSFRTALVKSEQARCMSGPRLLVIRPSNYHWHKMKDFLHFYLLLGIIPVGIIIFCVNVFIGPATLQAIPEGYVPKEYEYHQHPIKRFLQHYCFLSPQQEYEKYLHYLYHEKQVQKVRKLQQQANVAMGTQRDYRGPYFKEYYGSKYLYTYKDSLKDVHNRAD